MKFIKNNEYIDGKYTSIFEMDKCCAAETNESGINVLYTLMNSENISIENLCIEYNLGIYGNKNKKFTKKEFVDMFPKYSCFIEEFESGKILRWTVCLEDGTNICGDTTKEVKVSNDVDIKMFVKTMAYIESDSYKYNEFPDYVMKFLVEVEKTSYKVAVEILRNIVAQTDIYNEFVNAIQNGEYSYPDKMIEVQGYNAQKLVDEKKLKIIGAYDTLAGLRKDPDKYIEILNRGVILR